MNDCDLVRKKNEKKEFTFYHKLNNHYQQQNILLLCKLQYESANVMVFWNYVANVT